MTVHPLVALTLPMGVLLSFPSLADLSAVPGRIERSRKADAAVVGFAPSGEVTVECVSQDMKLGANAFDSGRSDCAEAKARCHAASATHFTIVADKAGVIRFRAAEGSYRLTGKDLKGRPAERMVEVAETNEPICLAANDTWIPVKDMGADGPVAGSALDFTSFADRAPCGTHGRLICVGDHYEFEKLPGKVQRFYGVNLCFDANFLPHRDAERFVSTLVRCGYNALRIHHHDKFLCPVPSDVSKIDAERFDRLDYLLAACARLGVYVTTDFYVNRRKDLLHRFKQDLPVDVELQRQHADYIRLFLGHRNPYRNGLRYADDPTLAFAAIVNEGNLGNHGFGVLEKSPLWQRAWGREFPKDEKSNPSLVQAFYRFLADKEVETYERCKSLVCGEIGSRILLSNMSCWTNPLVYQKSRTHFDYVEDHFYSDHPKWAGPDRWHPPVDVGGANWFCDARVCTRLLNTHRLANRPFMVSEASFPSPAKRHVMGGAVMGAWASLQGWDAVFRFAWAHGREALLKPRETAGQCFDISTDPAMQVGDRTAIALFLRGDMRPLKRRIAYHLPLGRLLKDEPTDPLYACQGWSWVEWYVRTAVATEATAPAGWETFGDYPGWVRKDGACVRKELFGPGVARDRWPEAGDGQVTLEPARGAFAYVTPRSCGGYAESGTIRAGSLSFTLETDGPTTVGCIALDGCPITDSKRLLVSHLVEIQQTGAEYTDVSRRILLDWGRPPRLMRAAKGRCALAVPTNGVHVFALDFSGNRIREIAPDLDSGKGLAFVCDTAADSSSATCEYEVVCP